MSSFNTICGKVVDVTVPLLEISVHLSQGSTLSEHHSLTNEGYNKIEPLNTICCNDVVHATISLLEATLQMSQALILNRDSHTHCNNSCIRATFELVCI